MPRRAASGRHGTLHRDDDTAPPIRGPRRAGHRAAGRRVRLPDPDPHPVRRRERLAVRDGVPRAVRLGRAERLPVRGGGRGLRPRPGDDRVAGPRTRTTRNASLTPRSRRRSRSSAASRRPSPSSAACSTSAGLCAYLTSSFAKDNPAQLVNGTEALFKALALMPQDESLARPVHRAAHEPGRGPVRRRDEEDVRRHEHRRDRPGREDHLRPRVHARAPGPGSSRCATSWATRRTRATGRSPARPSSRATRRCSCRSGPSAHDARRS